METKEELNTKEHVEALLAGRKGINPFLELLNIRLIEAREGRAVMEMEIAPSFLQGNGTMQGGLLGALADEAMAYAVISISENKESVATIDINHQHARPVSSGRLIARAHVERMGRRVAFSHAKVFNQTDGEERLVLISQASFVV